MRRLLLLLATIAVALPAPARADIGQSWEFRTLRERTGTTPGRAASVVPAGPAQAWLLGAAGAGAVALASAGSRGAGSRGDPPRSGVGADLLRTRLSAARSRQRTAARRALGLARPRARATLGIVGFHNSPPPPAASL